MKAKRRFFSGVLGIAIELGLLALINSPMLPNLKKNPDGSLTIYIQNKSPGKDKESNWLPAPNGPIYLAMRLYSPKTEPPSVLPPGEGTWQPPGIVTTK